jgi:hypothetical protein
MDNEKNIPESVTSANIVVVDGLCYELQGPVEEAADTFSIEAEFETCDDCVNGEGSEDGSSVPAGYEAVSVYTPEDGDTTPTAFAPQSPVIDGTNSNKTIIALDPGRYSLTYDSGSVQVGSFRTDVHFYLDGEAAGSIADPGTPLTNSTIWTFAPTAEAEAAGSVYEITVCEATNLNIWFPDTDYVGNVGDVTLTITSVAQALYMPTGVTDSKILACGRCWDYVSPGQSWPSNIVDYQIGCDISSAEEEESSPVEEESSPVEETSSPIAIEESSPVAIEESSPIAIEESSPIAIEESSATFVDHFRICPTESSEEEGSLGSSEEEEGSLGGGGSLPTAESSAAPTVDLGTVTCAYPGAGATALTPGAGSGSSIARGSSTFAAVRTDMENPSFSPTSVSGNLGTKLKNVFSTVEFRRSYDTFDLSTYTNPHMRFTVTISGAHGYRGKLYIVYLNGTAAAPTNPGAQISGWTKLGEYDLSGESNGSTFDIRLTGISLVSSMNIGYIFGDDFDNDGAGVTDAEITVAPTHIYDCV